MADSQKLRNIESPVPMFTIDEAYTIKFWSSQMEDLFRISREEAADAFCYDVVKCAHGKECILRIAKEETDVQHICPVIVRLANQKIKNIVLSELPIFNARKGFTGAVVYVTKLPKKSKTYCVNAKEEFSAIIGSIADGVFTTDRSRRIISFNRAAEEITGFRKKEAKGKFCRDIFRTNRCAEGCPLALALEKDRQIFRYELEVRDNLNRTKTVSANTSVLKDIYGRPRGGIVSFHDISTLKQLVNHVTGTRLFEEIVGRSKKMQEIFGLIEDIANSPSPVFITGESGTGKEMIADAIRRRSNRRDKPFIKVNCSVFSEGVLESELFGHVKGAFTDAKYDKPGRFEAANNGTLFLDEIGDAPPRVQLKLLRVLQEHEFERVGGVETIKADVRVIAAANKNLEEAVADMEFRQDLFCRLNAIPIHIPPLRKRKEDIPYLIERFLEKYRLVTGKEVRDISTEAMDILMVYDYPGNVRELENTIEYAFNRTKGEVIEETHLPLNIRSDECRDNILRMQKMPSEELRMVRTLEEVRWNRQKAAEKLGISRVTLWRHLKKHGL
ncbi:transcriptional regulatory protein ZraR [bacterium BMS3Abin05]|nr:transcriptional regulatory protein ZraR [bacterium BMS3Abin05]